MRNAEAELIAQKIPELLAITPNVLVCGDFNCTVDEAVVSSRAISPLLVISNKRRLLGRF